MPISLPYNRWQMALDIQDASNPSGVAHTIADTFTNMVNCGLDTVTLQTDPAMKIMVAKLADLMGLDYRYPMEAERQVKAALGLREFQNRGSYAAADGCTAPGND